ncbi:hypothetical protein TNCV_3829121 [Trichonephila clavipes]|nr:hypothetical protein TNCV_3829121 [Trichonephila clavipes]
MAIVDFLHHENSPTWGGIEPPTLCTEGQQQTNYATQAARKPAIENTRLKTYNVHPDIGTHGASDGMCRDRWVAEGQQIKGVLRPTRQQKKKNQENRDRQERQKDKTSGGTKIR